MNSQTPWNTMVFDKEKFRTMTKKLDAPQVGFVGELYITCCRTFASLIVELALEATSSVKFHATEELGRLRVWGDGFEAENGGMDRLLNTSAELRDAVVFLLTGVARKLEQQLSPGSDHYRSLTASIKKAELLFPDSVFTSFEATSLKLPSNHELAAEAETQLRELELELDSDRNFPQTDSPSQYLYEHEEKETESRDDIDRQLLSTLEYMNTLNNCLYELVPLLEKNHNRTTLSSSPNNQNTAIPSRLATGSVRDLLSETGALQAAHLREPIRLPKSHHLPKVHPIKAAEPRNHLVQTPDYLNPTLHTAAEQPLLHLLPGLTQHPRNTTYRSSLEPNTLPGSPPSVTSTISSPPHTSTARNDRFQDSESWLGPYLDPINIPESTEHSTATKSNTNPFTRTSKVGNRHYLTPAGAGEGLRCTFVENGRLCAETFKLPSEMRSHLIDKHMEFSSFQCDNCMRIFSHPSSRTKHLERADTGGRICPYQTTAGGKQFEIRKGVEEALWNICLEQVEVDAAVELITRYNGQLSARRRWRQSSDRSPAPGDRGRGPPSPLRDGHQPHAIRQNDHKRSHSTSTGEHSRNSQQYSVQSSHPHEYYHPQPQILQAHPPQFPQNWGGTSAADYTYNSSAGALLPQGHSADANEPTALPPGPSGYYPHP